MNDLKHRILDISYNLKLSHLGSCLTAVDIIDEIYNIKKKDDVFVLSSGHAALAWYCIIEKYEGLNAEDIFHHHGVHPDRCDVCHLSCSAGSLGNGLPIALGMALANKKRDVYCLISDGECSEGSIWEALRIANEQKLSNLKVYINCNGWGAYKKVTRDSLVGQCRSFLDLYITFRETSVDIPFLKGQAGHYVTMTKEQYESTR